MQEKKYSGLVLAAKRPGVTDPLARAAGVTHKCMVPINGVCMLERVVGALQESGCFRHIYICIDQADVLEANPALSGWLKTGQVSTLKAEGNLADSVLAAAGHIPDDHWPLMITTGDNALHTPVLIRDFIRGTEATGADVTLGITREETVLADLPEAAKAFHRVKDGGFSSCNVYALAGRHTLKTAEVFRGGGQFGKKHWRILKSFGLSPFILYKLRLVTVEDIARRIGKGFGLKIAPVFLPYAYGPIDVDDESSFRLSEKILKEREG